MANMNSLFAKPGTLTQPTQPTVQPTMKPAASTLTGTGTPWQRGTRGMDRVSMPGVKSYAPQPPAAPFGGVQSLSRPPQQPSGYDQFKANMPPMGQTMQPPQGNVSSRLFAQPRMQENMPTGFGGMGVAPTGDTSTWTPADWQRYNQFQQNPLAAALSNYGG